MPPGGHPRAGHRATAPASAARRRRRRNLKLKFNGAGAVAGVAGPLDQDLVRGGGGPPGPRSSLTGGPGGGEAPRAKKKKLRFHLRSKNRMPKQVFGSSPLHRSRSPHRSRSEPSFRLKDLSLASLRVELKDQGTDEPTRLSM